jgi:hypothetical protein
MVTTSVATPLASHSLLVEHSSTTRSRQPRQQPLAQPVACSILTPSGALLARAKVKPRPATLPADTYAVEISEVEPQGALEPLLRSNPQVVLRMPQEAQLALRIDHIIGPREQRTYYLQMLETDGE